MIAVGLGLAVLALYARTARYPYILFDDDAGLYKNPHVAGGLTLEGLRWAFTTTHLGNWIPLTWISHMLDFTLLGSDPGPHHLVNVLIHAANTILLFLIFDRMTRATYASGILAALFALHPLRVESVAWLIERKDVLSALFGLLAIWFYISCVERPTVTAPRIALAASYVASLLAKPMLVTLPLLLLLLDVWPLRRLRVPPSGAELRRLVVEKLPLAAIAIAASAVAWFAQASGGGARSLAEVPLRVRLGTVPIAYAGYIFKSFWPVGLGLYYPRDLLPAAASVLGTSALLTGISVAVVLLARTRPWFATGWFWFLVSLAPVCGLVQIGGTAMADRYSYLPSIGLGVMLVFGIHEAARGRGTVRSSPRSATYPYAPALGLGALVLCCALAVLSWRQIGFWRDSIALFEHTLQVAGQSAVIRNNLAAAYAQKGEVDAAINQYRRTLAIDPGFPDANANLGLALFGQGKTDEAIRFYVAELARDPAHPEALCHLGVALAVQGNLPGALDAFDAAIRARPDYADAHYDRGLALDRLGRRDEAIVELETLLAAHPDYPGARALLDEMRAGAAR